MDTINVLLHDSRFWAAVWLVIQTVLFYFLPTFPQEIWAAINGLFAVVLAVLSAASTGPKVRALRATRAANNPPN